MTLPYAMQIQWSERDQAYLVSLPDFDVLQPCTHGASYEDAAKNGREVLEMLVEHGLADGKPLPRPSVYDAGAAGPQRTRSARP